MSTPFYGRPDHVAAGEYTGPANEGADRRRVQIDDDGGRWIGLRVPDAVAVAVAILERYEPSRLAPITAPVSLCPRRKDPSLPDSVCAENGYPCDAAGVACVPHDRRFGDR